jgi:hypothetical protein
MGPQRGRLRGDQPVTSIVEFIEGLLRAAMYLHYSIQADTCPDTGLTGEELAAMRCRR